MNRLFAVRQIDNSSAGPTAGSEVVAGVHLSELKQYEAPQT